MPPNGDALSKSKEHRAAKFYLLTATKKALKDKSNEDDRPMSEIVEEALEPILFGGHGPPGQERIPILGRVAAGPALLADENVVDYVSLSGKRAHGAAFALMVQGNSMTPTLEDGDLVLVAAPAKGANNQIVVATMEAPGGLEGVVKRLRYPAPGSAELRSDNEEYEPIYTGFNVIGVVVASIRYY